MREMKDSGIEWIGDIPISWTTNKGKYLFQQRSTKGNHIELQLLSPTQKFGVIPQSMFEELTTNTAVKINEKTDLMTFKTIHRGDYCISLRSFQGGFEYSLYEGVVSPAYTVFFKKGDLCNGYYKYLFKDQSFIKEMNSYTLSLRDGKNISFDDFGNTYLPIPPLAEQEIITDYLDSKCAEIDSLISDIQSQIEALEEYKRSVITEAVTKGLDPDVEMRDSGYKWCPIIPKHWHKIPSKDLFVSSDIRKYPDDVLLTASQRHGIISQTEYMERENAKIVLANQGIDNWKHVEPNDFIISLRSFQGGLELSEVRGCITWHYIVLKATKPIIHKYYKWLFKSFVYIKALQGTCNFIRDGQDLRYSNFVQVPIFQPPMEEQQQIADYLDSKCAEIDSIIAKKKQQIETIVEYKKSMIFEYVTGKKEVQA